eukprot:c20951_g1_i1.p1 GENE.c20951_g1_i1~~c20951_g1_i1.p1  ORF type:complete len:127 (+),score=21.59 c20951_g1_i1:66-446(+)
MQHNVLACLFLILVLCLWTSSTPVCAYGFSKLMQTVDKLEFDIHALEDIGEAEGDKADSSIAQDLLAQANHACEQGICVVITRNSCTNYKVKFADDDNDESADNEMEFPSCADAIPVCNENCVNDK